MARDYFHTLVVGKVLWSPDLLTLLCIASSLRIPQDTTSLIIASLMGLI